ncbi:MAG: dockerin type I domain-containing protein [Planctomycetota bacterium]|jgi:hypothetical protein
MLRSITIAVAALLATGTAVAGTGAGNGPVAQGNPITLDNAGDAFYSTGPGVGHLECPADINEDDKVDVDDLILVILAYGSGGVLPSDVNEDGVVDLLDLMMVIENWGPCPS